jgi:molecular chaperone GrpE (heat shock protein)
MNNKYLLNQEKFNQILQKIGVKNLEEFSQISGVSQHQLYRLLHGLLPKMDLTTLFKISTYLQISLDKLIREFSPDFAYLPPEETNQAEIEVLTQEYQRLQKQLEQQKETLKQEFQQSSLQILEPWLFQWPTAISVLEKNPQIPAAKLVPIVKPIEQLLKEWGIEPLANVGEEISYDPQKHQLLEGSAQKGDRVKVRYTGYRQGDKLLYRAKVNPV